MTATRWSIIAKLVFSMALFVLTLCLAWGFLAFASTNYPGDGYGLALIGLFVGVGVGSFAMEVLSGIADLWRLAQTEWVTKQDKEGSDRP